MYFIRSDSNPIIASGHIMRCLTIAKSLIAYGEEVCFLIADTNPIPILEDAGVSFINLHSDWHNLMTDIDIVIELLKKKENSILLIDTYRINKEYVNKLKPYCKIVYLGSKPEYLGELDLLINYNADIDYAFYQSNYDRKTTLLLGPSFAPLRQEFQNIVHVIKKQIAHILITTGNTDPDHMIPSIVEGLLPFTKKEGIILNVIIGRMFDNKEELHSAYDNNADVILYENVKEMSALFRKCDLAISANGTTVYELSAAGVPTISFAIVDEQIKSAEALRRLGVIDYCGASYLNKEKCINTIIKKMQYYSIHNENLITLAKKAHNLIDGNGCQRITDVLLTL